MVEPQYKDRLGQAIGRAGVSINALAAAVGISYQAIKKAIDGTTKELSASNNSKAAKFLGVATDWLATGEGPMERDAAPVVLSAVHRQLLLDLEEIPPPEQSKVIDNLHQAAEHARAIYEHQQARRGQTVQPAKQPTMAAKDGGGPHSSVTLRYGDGNPGQRRLRLSTVADPFTAEPTERESAFYERLVESKRDQ